MSAKYPVVAITGSSGAGTTSVSKTFEQIFRREGVHAAFIEGDAFHRYDRLDLDAWVNAQRKLSPAGNGREERIACEDQPGYGSTDDTGTSGKPSVSAAEKSSYGKLLALKRQK